MVSRRTRGWPHGRLPRLNRDFPSDALSADVGETRDDCGLPDACGFSLCSAYGPEANHLLGPRRAKDSQTAFCPSWTHFSRPSIALHAQRLAATDDAQL